MSLLSERNETNCLNCGTTVIGKYCHQLWPGNQKICGIFFQIKNVASGYLFIPLTMVPLKLKDIREWLIDHRREFQLLEEEEFPSDYGVYDMYVKLHQFMGFYAYRHECEEAIKELDTCLNKNFQELINWTKKNEVLGSQKLLMFVIDYFICQEDVDEDLIKIQNGLYTERQPFNPIFCFSDIFMYLYWNNSIHETTESKKDQLLIIKEVRKMLKRHFHNRDKV
jgi:hypothetical protein